MTALAQQAVAVLETADPAAKAQRARDLATAWRSAGIAEVGSATPPLRPARPARPELKRPTERSEEHTSELQSLMRISSAVFCLKNKNPIQEKKGLGNNQEPNKTLIKLSH